MRPKTCRHMPRISPGVPTRRRVCSSSYYTTTTNNNKKKKKNTIIIVMTIIISLPKLVPSEYHSNLADGACAGGYIYIYIHIYTYDSWRER